ncbi:unnamed protein product [Periconia digitata]|uniref:Uncharacterized protein n=1 Tax=Periconia digitata TaxID=1303443 RepID=A0A9W4UGX9_9PLEO|nr:unnamed protein product [Periconia digitata]
MFCCCNERPSLHGLNLPLGSSLFLRAPEVLDPSLLELNTHLPSAMMKGSRLCFSLRKGKNWWSPKGHLNSPREPRAVLPTNSSFAPKARRQASPQEISRTNNECNQSDRDRHAGY